MQCWEYLTVLRQREWVRGHDGQGKISGTKWEPPIEELTKYGEDGWELVTVVPQAVPDTGSGMQEQKVVDVKDHSFTNEQLWVFKRPRR